MTNADRPLEFSFFQNKFDNQPKPQIKKWGELVDWYKKPKVIADETTRNATARLICPAVFLRGATRGRSGVDVVTMAVLDMDGGHDPDQFREEWASRGLEFIIHTSFSHRTDYPKWRAIFPFKTPVAQKDWEKVWRLLTDDLSHSLSDPACKDPSRMYFVPCVQDGAVDTFQCLYNQGEFIDPKPYIELIVPEESKQNSERSVCGADSPGNWLEANISIDEIVEPHGWIKLPSSDGMDKWRRPGKDHDCSATWGLRPEYSSEKFYCFSSSTPLPSRTSLSKFAVYAYLNHGGDFSEAAKGIAKKYGLTTKPKPVIESVEESDHFGGVTLDKVDPSILMQYGVCAKYVPLQELTLVEGRQGTGKTSVIVGIAASGSNGYDPIGQCSIEAYPSAYFGPEQRAPSIRRRFDQFGGKPEYFYVSGKSFDLDDEWLTKIEKRIQLEGWKTITFDPIWEYMPEGVNELRRRHVQKWLTDLQLVAERTNSAIFMVNHIAKFIAGKDITELGYMNGALASRARSHLIVFTNPHNLKERAILHGRGNMDNECFPAFGFAWTYDNRIDWIMPGMIDVSFVDEMLKGRGK